MRKLVLLVLACLLAFAAAVDVAVETDAAALSTDFAAEVQSAIDAQSDESVAEADEATEDEAEAEDEDEAEAEAEEEEESAEDAEEESEVFLEAESAADAEEEVDESDLAELDALEEQIDNAESVAEQSDEFAAEAETESFEQLEAEVAEVEEETDTFEEAVDSTDGSSFLESAAYDEVAADSMMEGGVSPAVGEDMRMAESQGIGKLLGSAAKAGLKAAAKAAGSEIGKAVGKAAVKLGKKVVSKAVDAVKKIAKKVANSKLGKAVKAGGKKLLDKAKKLAKKAIKGAKKIIKKLLGKNKKKKQNKKLKKQKKSKKSKKSKKNKKKSKKSKKNKKKCKKGPAGKKCRISKCKKHKLGCRFKCARSGWSRRHHNRAKACRFHGGVHPNWRDFDLSAEQNRDLDIKEGVLNPDGTPGPNADSHPPNAMPGEGGHPGGSSASPSGSGSSSPVLGGSSSSSGVPMVPATISSAANGDAHNTVVSVGPTGRKGWNGVNPRYKGQPDLPPVKRLPEDVEDCVACQYVWKQVEQDVGNSAITQTIYDSFHANALEAQRTPIFYPACQTMFDAADDMIGDYMEGFTVDQICENSMLCRPRDLNQFLKHQRRTKGI